MLIESLHEFCTLARVLNFTKAALELHQSQSSLSRHIQSMERELGFSLIGRRNDQIYVTKEGNHFLNGIYPLIESYETLVHECRNMLNSKKGEIFIQEPPFGDLASICFLKSCENFKMMHPDIEVRYKDTSGRDLLDSLDGSFLDVVFEYQYGEKEDIEQYYHDNNLGFVHLCDVSPLVWMDKNNKLAQHEKLEIKDILDVPVMLIYDSFAPMRKAIEDMYEINRGRIKAVNLTITHKYEYYLALLPPNAIYILPEGIENNINLRSRQNMKFVPLVDQKMKFYAVFREGFNQSEHLNAFFSHLNNCDLLQIAS